MSDAADDGDGFGDPKPTAVPLAVLPEGSAATANRKSSAASAAPATTAAGGRPVGLPALIRDISAPNDVPSRSESISFSSTLQALPSPKSEVNRPAALDEVDSDDERPAASRSVSAVAGGVGGARPAASSTGTTHTTASTATTATSGSGASQHSLQSTQSGASTASAMSSASAAATATRASRNPMRLQQSLVAAATATVPEPTTPPLERVFSDSEQLMLAVAGQLSRQTSNDEAQAPGPGPITAAAAVPTAPGVVAAAALPHLHMVPSGVGLSDAASDSHDLNPTGTPPTGLATIGGAFALPASTAPTTVTTTSSSGSVGTGPGGLRTSVIITTTPPSGIGAGTGVTPPLHASQLHNRLHAASSSQDLSSLPHPNRPTLPNGSYASSPAPVYRMPLDAPYLGVLRIPPTPECMPRPQPNLTPAQLSVANRGRGPRPRRHSMAALSHDMLLSVCYYLSPIDLVRLSRVSSQWKYVFEMKVLWSGPGGVLQNARYFFQSPEVCARFQFLQFANRTKADSIASDFLVESPLFAPDAQGQPRKPLRIPTYALAQLTAEDVKAAEWSAAVRGRGRSFFVATEKPEYSKTVAVRQAERVRLRGLADAFDWGLYPTPTNVSRRAQCIAFARVPSCVVATAALFAFLLLLAIRLGDGSAADVNTSVPLYALFIPLFVMAAAVLQVTCAVFGGTFFDPRPALPTGVRTEYDREKTPCAFAMLRLTLLVSGLLPVAFLALLYVKLSAAPGTTAAELAYVKVFSPLIALFGWLSAWTFSEVRRAPCSAMFDRSRVATIPLGIFWVFVAAIFYGCALLVTVLVALRLDSRFDGDWYAVFTPLYVSHALAYAGLGVYVQRMWDDTERADVPQARMRGMFWRWLAANTSALAAELVLAAQLNATAGSSSTPVGVWMIPFFVFALALPLCVKDTAEVSVDFPSHASGEHIPARH